MSTKDKKSFSLKSILTIAAVAVLLIVAVIYYCVNKAGAVATDNNRWNLFVFGKELSASGTDELTIHFIDVGQGDCIFIQFPDNKNMLIDGGPRENSKDVTDYLDNLGIKKIDLVLATHSHADHVGGLIDVFDRYDVSYCLRPMIRYEGEYEKRLGRKVNLQSVAEYAAVSNTYTYYKLLHAIETEKCGWSFFDKDSDFTQQFSFDGGIYTYSFDFLTPTADKENIAYDDLNNYSPICVLNYCGFSVMFTGDAEAPAEREYLGYYKQIGYNDVDVLKVGHHGSKTSSLPEFIEAVNPECCVIMCGKDNENGHPHEKTVDTLSSRIIYRTDLLGSVTISVKSDGVPDYTPDWEDTL